jgi:acetylornithine/succinyldiaminopimelate/putrescine aminotransferase
VNPGLATLLERIGYDRFRIVAARDVHYVTDTGESILDCWGGFGTLNVGHNHPRLARARREFDELELPELCHAFVPAHAAVLAKNLALLMPGDLEVSYLCCTGSEAVEAALKLAQKAKGNPQGRVLYAEGAMHGKTLGALSVTGNERVRRHFRVVHNWRSFPFGDADALSRILDSCRSGLPSEQPIALILEPIQCGGGVMVPPSGYLARVRRLCDEHGIVFIVDEVQIGLGRTGKLFAFEHDGIVPDIVTLSKALGGGKTPVAACVARAGLYREAYGATEDATLHNSTFSEMGGPAALATETLRIIVDERLAENAARVGAYLHSRLDELWHKFPELVVDVRGRGLLAGIELRTITDVLPGGTLARQIPALDKYSEGVLSALVANELLFAHNILVAFTDFNRNVLRVEPPLTFREAHVDELTRALERVLAAGPLALVKRALVRRIG